MHLLSVQVYITVGKRLSDERGKKRKTISVSSVPKLQNIAGSKAKMCHCHLKAADDKVPFLVKHLAL